jgi:hypothetical protein
MREEKDCVSVASMYTLQLNRHLGGVQPKGSSECPGSERGGGGRADARVGDGGSHPSLQLPSEVGGLSPLLGYKYMDCRKEPKDVLFHKFRFCTAPPRTEFFIEPPPDTQRKRRRGEREIGVTRGSYLLLTGLSPPFPPSSPTPRAYCIAWGCVIRTYPPPHSTPP